MRRITIRMLLPVVVFASVSSACSSSSVEIMDASASLNDTRIELVLASCNAALVVDVIESGDEVVVTVSDADAPLIRTSGSDCLDIDVVHLDEPLGNRTLVDGTTGSMVSVVKPLSDLGMSWPYDRGRVTEEQYLAALDEMVACLETEDSEIDAWVYQALDWKTYRWDKDPTRTGT